MYKEVLIDTVYLKIRFEIKQRTYLHENYLIKYVSDRGQICMKLYGQKYFQIHV